MQEEPGLDQRIIEIDQMNVIANNCQNVFSVNVPQCDIENFELIKLYRIWKQLGTD